MNNRKYAFFGLVALVIITMVTTILGLSFAGAIVGIGFARITKEDIDFFKKFLAYKNLISETYYQDVDTQKIYDGALHGMADAVGDQYTMYLGKDENDDFMEEIDSKYEGLGVYVSISVPDNKILVNGFLDDSPAKEAGMKELDKIIKVNGEPYEGDELEEAVNKMKGKAGEPVNITVLRDGKEVELTVLRKEINIKNLEYENKSGIGYIEIKKFDNNIAESFNKAYDTLKADGVTGLIIDIRDNGGGVYDEVVKIAKKIIPEGLIVYTEDKNGKQEKVFSESDGIDIPLVVLINGNSASASEILAGAVKDRKCGTLVGTKTYGKGVVQGVFEMNDGTAMKITISKYYTPNGVCIDGTGIEPDVVVKNNIFTTKDEQLEKALEILKK